MTHSHRGIRTLDVRALTRVEGEGAMHVNVVDGQVTDVRLEIYEPPRFFEALLRGRNFTEPPDITARICGICPVAYQMSACHAIEQALGVTLPADLRDLRRLLYCGEWIESHALHIYLLHAPDFLGFRSAIELARDHRALVERGLRMKKVGNELIEIVGGRAIHPVNVRVGGFYRSPSQSALAALVEPLRRARQDALDTVAWVGGFEFPDFTGDWELVSLRHPHEYPLNEGRLVSDRGLDIDVANFLDHVAEEHVPHSNALQAHLLERGEYLVGPLARYSLNYDKLPEIARQAAVSAGLGPVCRNPFQSIIVRAVELVFALDEALRIVESYAPPRAPSVSVIGRAGRGHSCTEAPRGTLYHRYDIGADGSVLDAVIIPPTSQNQHAIEHDMREFVSQRLHLDDGELTRQCEQAIRNYDPCISCATHFLDLTIVRA